MAKPKVQFDTNIAKVLLFPYGDAKTIPPKEHEGRTLPEQHLYSVIDQADTQAKNLYASAYLHSQLQRAGMDKGFKGAITIKEDPDDRKKRIWEVVVLTGGEKATQDQQQTPEQPPPEDEGPAPGPYDEPATNDTGIPPMAEIGAVYLSCLRISEACWDSIGRPEETAGIQAGAATMFIRASQRNVSASPKMHIAFREVMNGQADPTTR